jgi:hypothetical protein
MSLHRWSVALFLLAVFVLHSTADCYAVDLLASDRATGKILAFDGSTGAYLRVVVPADPTNLISPAGMAIGFGGDLFVTSQGTGKVLRYNSINGAPKGSTPGSSVFLDSLPGPTGLLYDSANDRLFVSMLGNADSTLIKIYSGSGADLGTINAGPAAGRAGMVLDSSGNLYVNSFNAGGFGPDESGAVLKFDGPGFTNMTTLIAGDHDFDPQEPIIAGMNGLAIDGSGTLYSTSLFGQQVIKLTTGGQVTGVIGSQNPPTAYPAGVLVVGSSLLVSTLGNDNPADPIYGAFQFPGSVQKFALDGTPQGVLVNGANLPGGQFQPTSILTRPTPKAGDFDGDNDVDGADFVAWQTNFPKETGATLAHGDGDGDGDVDGADFVIWQTNFPSSGGPGSSPVPEPAGFVLAAAGMLGYIAMRRGRRSRG